MIDCSHTECYFEDHKICKISTELRDFFIETSTGFCLMKSDSKLINRKLIGRIALYLLDKDIKQLTKKIRFNLFLIIFEEKLKEK